MFTMPWWLLAVALIACFWVIGAHKRLKGLRRAVTATFPSLAAALAARREAAIAWAAASVPPPAAVAAHDDLDPPAPVEVERARAAEALRHAAHQAAAALEAAAPRPLVPGHLGTLSIAEQVFEQALEACLAVPAADGALPVRPPALAAAELSLALARQDLNRAIDAHNAALRQPPASLLAALLGFRTLAALGAGPRLAVAPASPYATPDPARAAADPFRAA